MTVSEFTENPIYQSVSEKMRRFAAYLASLPLAWWRNLLIVFALIWACRSLAALFWLVFPSVELPQPERLAAPPALGTGAANTVSVDIAALQTQNLFGELGETRSDIEEEQQTAAIGDDVVAQETRLSIKLHGVVASFDPQYARAIIEDGKDQFLVRINDELPGNKGVKLARVMDSKVILDNRGKYESLSLYNDDDFAAPISNRAGRPNNIRVPRGGQNKSRSGASKGTKADLAKRATLRKEQMPKSIGDVVRFSVHRENGAMVGYRVRPGRDRELFEQVGLKTNDVVTTVNGIRMDDPKQLKAVYQSLKTATSADLGVLRNGEELSINISVEGG
ncbi:MAG: type II secretion system protein GspC [Cellvibrionaceae bacterium]|nr:type II secretion system protein GspC [Cellvibrionaceae bacterium]